MTSPCVAAVIPVFNRPRAVLDALDSIAAQTRLPDTVIVVDDGSTDDTAEQVAQWVSSHRDSLNCRLIRQNNQGVSAARNHGVAQANGCQLLAFLDSDDLWPADYLARMTEVLIAAPGAVAASCDLRQEDHRTGRSQVIRMSRMCGQATANIFLHGPSPPSSTVVRAEAFDRAGGFELRYCGFEDYYICLRLSTLGQWLYVPGTQVMRRSFLGSTHGGQTQLTETFGRPAFQASQMRMLHRFVHTDGGKAVLPAGMQRSVLARCWYRLGRSFARYSQPAKAVRCFKAASRCDPWLLRAYRRRATAALRVILGRWLTSGLRS